MFTRNNAVANRIRICAFLCVCALCFLAYRVYQVQIVRHKELYKKARSQYTAVKKNRGKRGEIYDYSGNLLVGNIPCSNVFADPQLTGNAVQCAKLTSLLVRELGVPRGRTFRKLRRKFYYRKNAKGEREKRKLFFVPIKSQVSFEKSEKLKRKLKEAKLKGVFFKETTKRFYPKNEMLANILGFTNIDRDKAIAVIGIEKFFNKAISSSQGTLKFERARDGRMLSYGDKESEKVRDGLNLYLTIQEPLQAIMEEELDKLVAKWHPKAAYAVMADPYTGSILAVAQRPSFNPNNRKNMNPNAWRCRIIEDIFEPGSTMKPIAVAGALDYGLVNPNSRFNCENGMWYYKGKPLRDSHPMKILTVSEIVQKSSNIGTAKIALLLGKKRLNTVLRRFGFGYHTGIPLKPETRGIFRSPNHWDSLSITRFPIGQGIGVSPVQLLRAYCALANGGKLYKLRLVDRLESAHNDAVIKIPVSPPVNVFKRDDTCERIIAMMKLVTQSGGTARRAAIKGYSVAGKTGTSEKFINGAYRKKYFSSFIGFVPADKPAFVLLVTADEPKGSYYGGTVSAPAFRNISERSLRYLDIKPDQPQEIDR